MEEQRRRVDENMTRIIEEIDKSYLRKMQKNMHLCSAQCCDNHTFDMVQIHNCVEKCSSSFSKAQHYVQGEVERVQNRLQRCIIECNDTVKDKMGPNPTQSEVNRYTAEFETCANKCVDYYCELLPSFEKNMKTVLSGNEYV